MHACRVFVVSPSCCFAYLLSKDVVFAPGVFVVCLTSGGLIVACHCCISKDSMEISQILYWKFVNYSIEVVQLLHWKFMNY